MPNFQNKEIIQYEKVHMKNKNMAIDMMYAEKNATHTGCEFHWHEQLEFYYIEKGGVSLICSGHQDWLFEKDVGFVNWCQPHRGNSFLDDTRFYNIKFDLSLLKDDFSETCLMPYSAILINTLSPTFIKGDITLSNYFGQLIKELNQKKFGYEIVVKSMALSIIAHILRLSSNNILRNKKSLVEINTLQHIHHILQYISENYTSHIVLDDISSKLGLSKSYMCRIFKKYTNNTILSYINELKCSHAATLILNGMPLLDVCEEVGYHDYNYFSRLFKKIYGVSPKNYNTINIQHILLD